MIALLAVFVLLVQALGPAFAAAPPMRDDGTTICTTMGLRAVPDDPGAPPVDHACKHCLCPAPAAAPPVVSSTGRVAYALAEAPTPAPSRTRLPPPRGPPRPPGQGPPSSDA